MRAAAGANGNGSILVAFDGSPAAGATAGSAIQIARSEHRAIRGLYVVDDALIMNPYANHQVELGSVAERKSRANLLAQFQRRGEGRLAWLAGRCRAAQVPVTVDIVLGKVPEQVLQAAGEAVLLALGRCGHGHAADPSRLGRHFRAIAHHAPCPLLVGGAQEREVRRLLLAYNGSVRARRALTWTVRLQRALPAEVVVVSVQHSERDTVREWSQEARNRLDEGDLAHYRFLTRAGEPVSEIVTAATEHQADFILMGGYRHTAAMEWLVGSTVDGVLRRARLPIVVA
ncbi:MAG: universal stress protein [Candidatus Binatia bacterium]